MRVVKALQPLLAIMLMSGTAYAGTITVGTLTLTGNFTLNHDFDFNDLSAAPFGEFGTLSASGATGIFAPYVTAGDVLSMSTTDLYESYGVKPVILPSGDVMFGELPEPVEWNIGGFEIDTLWTNAAGAPWVGMHVIGLTDLTGHGFDPTSYPYFARSYWSFTAPAFDHGFSPDITGPIELTVAVQYDVPLPDSGSTALYLAVAILSVFLFRRKPRGGAGPIF